MSDNNKTQMNSLDRIWHVCRSPLLSKDAKLAYVMLAAPQIDGANTCYVDPAEDVKDGLQELGRIGLIRLEIDGYEFGARIIQDSPAFLPVGTLERIERNNHVDRSVSVESEMEKQRMIQQHMKEVLQRQAIETRPPLLEITTSIIKNEDNSVTYGIESAIPLRQVQIRRNLHPNEVEWSFQKNETPTSGQEQNHPPDPPLTE